MTPAFSDHAEASRHHRQSGWQFSVKVAADRMAALMLLAATSPVLLAVAAAIWKRMGRPIFFCQERSGRHGVPFRILKFRTMIVDEHAPISADGTRLTPLGRWLRSWSLDELPQLVNVLRGEMSLVGPRPLLPQYVPLYTPTQARRLEVLPGITGWAQVNGRNDQTWEQRFRLDVEYVDRWSLWLDAKIFALTIKNVLTRTGVSRRGEATMPEFRGTDPDGAAR
jgi:sugar transferase EpsL